MQTDGLRLNDITCCVELNPVVLVAVLAEVNPTPPYPY